MKKYTVLSTCLCLVFIASLLVGDSKATSSVHQMSITVWNKSELNSLRPVTGGIPLIRGAAPKGVHFALYDENDKPVPLQTTVLARWKDGSARWVLLDFPAQPAPEAKTAFKLGWDKNLKAVKP